MDSNSPPLEASRRRSPTSAAFCCRTWDGTAPGRQWHLGLAGVRWERLICRGPMPWSSPPSTSSHHGHEALAAFGRDGTGVGLDQLSRAGLLIWIDPQRRLGHKLVRQERVGRVNSAKPCIAEQTFQPSHLKNPEATCQLHGGVDDPPGSLDHPILCRDDLGAPGSGRNRPHETNPPRLYPDGDRSTPFR